MDIKEITESEALELINSSNQTGLFKPIGLFWHKSKACGPFVAIDNSNGDALIEEFETLDSCLKYLRRESCTSINGFTY